MPPLPGFSENPFKTREDVIQAAKALIAPLHQYKSPLGARIKIPVETGTQFDETAAQLEGFARPLWAVSCLLASSDAKQSTADDETLKTWPNGLIAGTDPHLDGEYWGEVGDMDQRMVEMEIIAFALLVAPSAFWPSSANSPSTETNQDVEERRKRIVTWLGSINGKEMPVNNWLWFRVLVNVVLVKTCGVLYEELREAIEADFKLLDSFEMDGGGVWSCDGPWGNERKQADYYSGSFAIQYSQLIFVKFASDMYPERAERYKKRAGLFALEFMRYFDEDGAGIPFGRSLTYRFAMGAFWSVVAFAEIELPPPLDDPGVIKGLLLRHLRYWAENPAIFHSDGTFNIGYAFPNAYMSEDYNSPQSPYWCLKTFVAMSLPATNPFWTCEELPHPLFSTHRGLEVAAIPQPLQITCNSSNHHFMLSSGQFAGWPLKAREAKYGKFAYSSAFGFSVPTGPLLQQMTPDSTLALSIDGEETWKVTWKNLDARIESVEFMEKGGKKQPVPVLRSRWIPWKNRDFHVETTLIPPTDRWPDWHVRVHKFLGTLLGASVRQEEITAVSCGFAILGQQKKNGLALPRLNDRLEIDGTKLLAAEGFLEAPGKALVISEAGASGIRYLKSKGEGLCLKPDANTNLMTQRTLIPMLKSHIDLGDGGMQLVVTAVFAVAARDGKLSLSSEELRRGWEDPPVFSFGDYTRNSGIEEYIQV